MMLKDKKTGQTMEIGAAPDAGPGTEQGQGATRTFAGLTGDDYGDSDGRPPLVLLHGLTFDRSLWRPSLAELRRIDPGRRVLALDLPGHGASAGWPSYDAESIARGVHRAVEEARLQSPVVVGHSIAGVIATVYAARYPTRGIINVDQSLQVARFAGLVQSLADKLRGAGFPAVWQMFAASMHVELLPETAQELVRSSCQPRQELVLAYWRELLERPVNELAGFAADTLAAVRSAGVPYLVVAGADLEPDYQKWLTEMLPQAAVTVWPGSGHFPHLAHPGSFAECLAATGRHRGTAPVLFPHEHGRTT
jgi:pimeloyl-ACP methyl ester carboxylesterase